jgi:hypothetical protein
VVENQNLFMCLHACTYMDTQLKLQESGDVCIQYSGRSNFTMETCIFCLTKLNQRMHLSPPPKHTHNWKRLQLAPAGTTRAQFHKQKTNFCFTILYFLQF